MKQLLKLMIALSIVFGSLCANEWRSAREAAAITNTASTVDFEFKNKSEKRVWIQLYTFKQTPTPERPEKMHAVQTYKYEMRVDPREILEEKVIYHRPCRWLYKRESLTTMSLDISP